MEVREPFRYPIRNREIARELEEVGFQVWHSSPTEVWVEAPADISITKARRMISVMIRLYQASKAFDRSRSHYEELVEELNTMNTAR